MDFKLCKDVSLLGIKVVFLVIFDIDNTTYDQKLEKKIYRFYENFRNNYSLKNLDDDINIVGYRDLHKKIGITDKSLIASPESTIKILIKYKFIKSINFIVDVYNYVAIKNKISIGAHDIGKICGGVKLCFTRGNENFIPLGSKSKKSINKNEYCYIDDSNEIICRLDCRQSDKTKTSTSTKDCLFIIQGNSYISEKKLLLTAQELRSLIMKNAKDDNNFILKLI